MFSFEARKRSCRDLFLHEGDRDFVFVFIIPINRKILILTLLAFIHKDGISAAAKRPKIHVHLGFEKGQTLSNGTDKEILYYYRFKVDVRRNPNLGTKNGRVVGPHAWGKTTWWGNSRLVGGRASSSYHWTLSTLLTDDGNVADFLRFINNCRRWPHAILTLSKLGRLCSQRTVISSDVGKDNKDIFTPYRPEITIDMRSNNGIDRTVLP